MIRLQKKSYFYIRTCCSLCAPEGKTGSEWAKQNVIVHSCKICCVKICRLFPSSLNHSGTCIVNYNNGVFLWTCEKTTTKKTRAHRKQHIWLSRLHCVDLPRCSILKTWAWTQYAGLLLPFLLCDYSYQLLCQCVDAVLVQSVKAIRLLLIRCIYWLYFIIG